MFLMIWHVKDIEYGFQPAHVVMIVKLVSTHPVGKG